MSAVTHGMDTAAGLAAGGRLESGAQEITALASRMDQLLEGFDWTGVDAERTRASWAETERPSLTATADALRGFAALLKAEAEAQDTVSGDGSGVAAAASGGGLAAAAVRGGGLGSWLTDRIGAFFTGVGRTLGHAGDLASKVGDVLTGTKDWPVVSVVASALATVGAGAGAVVNAVTGTDNKWFAEAGGRAGTPVPVPAQGQGTPFQPALVPPTDLPSLMQGVSDGYQVGHGPGSTGDVRITRVDNGGTPAYVVAIPGTESWSPSAGGQPRDLSANLGLVAGDPTAAAESVRAAMDAADIPPGSPVLLVGHSQGGIIAASLASDPAFVERYGVTNVLTYGAPVDHIDVAPGVDVLQVQHRFDVVPRLDLGGERFGGAEHVQIPTVTLDSPGGVLGPVVNHNYDEYAGSVREALAADTEAGRMLRDYQSQLWPFLVGPGGSASAVDVPVSRDTD